MTMEEKHRLGMGLQSLPQEKMDNVVQIIRKRNGHLSQDGDEIELDIEAMDTETLWELDRFVTNYKKMASKIRRQALLANNVVSNGTDRGEITMKKIEAPVEMKKPKKADAGEEDVDIGDEMPMSSFPPVEIEKDNDVLVAVLVTPAARAVVHHLQVIRILGLLQEVITMQMTDSLKSSD
ncbi:transcription factor GTE7-like isoform X2 [Hibiscus syriacus]|uniref:transcription factor GTE7-like isoform X2 n=1 Tax=Hibiscus syriacus TaxID=106335 RepID=UPI001920A2CE|nr:transcription factor GTE7-like isoform X2 [Hibiscus syriacus]